MWYMLYDVLMFCLFSSPQLPLVERSTYSCDMYELYNEACLPGSLADVTIMVSPVQLLTKLAEIARLYFHCTIIEIIAHHYYFYLLVGWT